MKPAIPCRDRQAYSGFAFFDVDEEYKAIFCDAIQGFGEYAKLKGYSISLAIDNSLPGKVGIKIVIIDAGVTVSTNTIKKDVDEYIKKMKTCDDLRDMPVVTDQIEHERLVSAITMRFTYLKHEAELHRMQSVAYQRMFEGVQRMAQNAISYSPPPHQNVSIVLDSSRRGDNNMAGDTYKTEHSPGASVGIGNVAHIEGSSIIIWSSNEQRAQQATSVEALMELVKTSKLTESEKNTAVRHLENVQEELSGGGAGYRCNCEIAWTPEIDVPDGQRRRRIVR